MTNKIAFFVTLIVVAVFSGTTNVRIYHQAVASPASVRNKQIGVNTGLDANIGYKMWFGKDADGNVTQFLAKDKNARVLSMRQDSSFSKKDTSGLYKGDSAFISGLKATRANITSNRGDTIYSVRDTSKLMKADSGNFSKLATGSLSIDTAVVGHVLTLTKNSGTYATSGMIWNDSAEASFENFSNGIKGTFNRCLFAQDDITLDSNSTGEVSMRGNDTIHGWLPGSDSLPANWFRRGKKLKIIIRGIYSSKATSPGTMTAKLKLNDTIVATTGAIPLSNDQTDETWLCEGAISTRAVGASGSIVFVSAMQFAVANVWNKANFYTLGKTINTTIKQRLDLTLQFSTADAKNKVRVIQFELDEIH